MDNEDLKYVDAEPTATDKDLETVLWEENLLPYKEETFDNKLARNSIA